MWYVLVLLMLLELDSSREAQNFVEKMADSRMTRNVCLLIVKLHISSDTQVSVPLPWVPEPLVPRVLFPTNPLEIP